jgi:hypothetical protein
MESRQNHRHGCFFHFPGRSKVSALSCQIDGVDVIVYIIHSINFKSYND